MYHKREQNKQTTNKKQNSSLPFANTEDAVV